MNRTTLTLVAAIASAATMVATAAVQPAPASTLGLSLIHI